MAVNWTEEQQKVIELRDRNLLVAAAAGSGKTAVLVERIISRITDETDPVDVDQLLIVTFTKAAAAQMRDRIGQALRDRLAQTPEDLHLQKQLTLLHYAQITTIDSFCLHILRSHFDELDMDPDFRVADEGELKLIRADLTEQLLEDCYQSGNEDFLLLADTQASGKTDAALGDLIERLYTFANSHPFPERLLKQWGSEWDEPAESSDFSVTGAEQAGVDPAAAAVCSGGSSDSDGAMSSDAYGDASAVSYESTDAPRDGMTADMSEGSETSVSVDGRLPFEDQEWFHSLLEQLRREAWELSDQYTEAIHTCMEEPGLSPYAEMFAQDRANMERVAQSTDYQSLKQALEDITFVRKPTIRDKSVDPGIKKSMSDFRDQRKKSQQKMQKLYLYPDTDEMVRQLRESHRPLRTLCGLTIAFMDRFASYKKEKRLVDFGDLEHMALQILVTEEDGKVRPTAAAIQLQHTYREVMIDEYQDSNMVQELILSSVAGHWIGKPNRFMVGDVKQSIYKFRMARPEIFLDKYASYTEEDSEDQKIDLHKNFRSRAGILDATNFVFRQLMSAPVGGITYDDRSALYLGADYPEYTPDAGESAPPCGSAGTAAGSAAGQEADAGAAEDCCSSNSAMQAAEKAAGSAAGQEADAGAAGDCGSSQSAPEAAETADGSAAGLEADAGAAEDCCSSQSAPEAAETACRHDKDEVSQKTCEIRREDYKTELMLVDLEDEDGLLEDADSKETEARAVEMRIKELTDPQTGLKLWDKENGTFRPAGYGDIVILLRTFAGWADTFVDVLLDAGIPAYAQSSTGYFTALEVQTVLNLLRILDNPMQDIPLTSVLKSPIGDFTSEELARIMARFEHDGCPGGVRGMYGACLHMAELSNTDEGSCFSSGANHETENGSIYQESSFSADALRDQNTVRQNGMNNDKAAAQPDRTNDDQITVNTESGDDDQGSLNAEEMKLTRKVSDFLDQLAYLRRLSVVLPLHELLQRIYDDTGYYDLVSVMPDGAVRQANLDMLMEKAVDYEQTSYYGLFDFVRYIENLRKYDVDFGEAAPEGEGSGTVRITTIHKSKGLEYPVVIVAGLGKRFNRQDSRARILMHPELGLAADYVDPDRRIRTVTLKKQVLAKQLDTDGLGEELRVLYVAMTRAKEKLILTGADRKLKKKCESNPDVSGSAEDSLPSFAITEASSCLDWLLMCMTREGDMDDPSLPIRVRKVSCAELQAEESVRQEQKSNSRQSLENWDTTKVYDAQAREEIRFRLSYTYGHMSDETLPVKVSVSELKHDAIEEDEESCSLISSPEPVRRRPRFLEDSQAVLGASRGTVYHRILEKIDIPSLASWGEKGDRGSLNRLLDKWTQEGILTETERKSVSSGRLLTFASSDIARRMASATAEGLLHREQPFVMGLPAREIYPDSDSDELVVVRGIIDAYWQEDDGIHVLDYKTDAVSRQDGEQVLRDRYETQLRLYARALAGAMGLPVCEIVIYSFTLETEIRLST